MTIRTMVKTRIESPAVHARGDVVVEDVVEIAPNALVTKTRSKRSTNRMTTIILPTASTASMLILTKRTMKSRVVVDADGEAEVDAVAPRRSRSIENPRNLKSNSRMTNRPNPPSMTTTKTTRKWTRSDAVGVAAVDVADAVVNDPKRIVIARNDPRGHVAAAVIPIRTPAMTTRGDVASPYRRGKRS